MKLELEKTLADLSSAKLFIKLLQKQGHTNEVEHGCTANWNGIQNEKSNSSKPRNINGQQYPNYRLLYKNKVITNIECHQQIESVN
jgi:hypothetical protein